MIYIYVYGPNTMMMMMMVMDSLVSYGEMAARASMCAHCHVKYDTEQKQRSGQSDTHKSVLSIDIRVWWQRLYEAATHDTTTAAAAASLSRACANAHTHLQ